jgi:GNAT superfamily N-acetyltransferase
LILDPDHTVYVADVSEGILAGFAHVFITIRLFINQFAEIGGAVVDERFRDRGIGSLLLSKSERWVVDLSCQEIRVRSNIKRTGAKKFYLAQEYLENKKQRVFLKKLSHGKLDI